MYNMASQRDISNTLRTAQMALGAIPRDVQTNTDGPLRERITKAWAYYNRNHIRDFEAVLENALTLEVSSLPAYQNDLLRIYALLTGHFVRMACSKLGKNRVGYQDKVQNLIESMDNLQLNFTDVQHLLCRGFALILIELRLDEASNHFVTALRQVPHCVQALLGLACLAYSRGEYKMALGYFKSVLLHRPQGSMADVRVGIAHCFVQLGDLDRARRAFELALEHNGHSINALIGIAQLKLNQRQPNSTKEGVNLLREAFEQNPHHPLVLTWLSAHCYYEGNYEKLQLLAGNAYRITDDPLIQSQDCFQLARCFHAMKNYDLAFNFYGKSLNEYPHSYAPTEFGIAQIYVRRGDLVRGEELLKSVLNKLPQQPQALRMLATFYSQSGKFEAAVELINIALMHSPTNDYDIWLGLADIYERKQLWQQSLHAYEKAKYIYQGLSESPRDVPLTWRNNIAALQFYANQSKEALQTLNAVMPVTQDEHCESNMLTLKFNRARILEELRQDEQAENIYKQLMREYPNYTDSYLRLGAMAYKRNKIDTALEFFNAVLQRDEHNKAARKLLGICYCKQGSVLHALNHYNAIRRQPQHQHDSEILVSQGNVLLIQAQEDIARGQPEESRRNVENALQLFRKALEQNQCNLWATNGIAVSLTLNGHLADGEKMFELIVNTSNRCTDAILNIAHIALEQQQYAKAIEMYRKYLQEDLLPVNKVQVMQYLARSLYQGGRFEEARDVLIRARHVAPQNRTLLYNLAVAMKQHSQSVFETKLARQELQIAQRFFVYLGQTKEETLRHSRWVLNAQKLSIECRQLLENATEKLEDNRLKKEPNQIVFDVKSAQIKEKDKNEQNTTIETTSEQIKSKSHKKKHKSKDLDDDKEATAKKRKKDKKMKKPEKS
ncbi:RNA polymerase-associated protein CTR9 homolog [Drosophila grimshawi]|uniref:RNA polymerase-associated protein CTR9 homolog n=1 Tax=Drosophila grimshawi TaxID=7222 RepID=UPI000C86EB3D|nr:RNA polymerase-associated protein CTR9 homolog [Drosophila grimshawi]